jgi:hypothetical protein
MFLVCGVSKNGINHYFKLVRILHYKKWRIKNNMKMKFSLILLVILISLATGVYAEFNDVKESSNYFNDVNQLQSLNIILGDSGGNFGPNKYLTREELAIMMVRLFKMEKTAVALSKSSNFSDVDKSRFSNGYINLVNMKNIITGLPNGKFYPRNYTTFSQLCTVAIRALDYSNQDLSGSWPKNYINKAKELGLTEGINLNGNDYATRWAASTILNRALDVEIKNSDSLLGEKLGSFSYKDYTVINTNLSDKNLLDNQIQTDMGVYYLENGIKGIELGKKYKMYIANNIIKRVKNNSIKVDTFSVESIIDKKISYFEKNIKKELLLPEYIKYYYKGSEVKLADVKKNITINSTLKIGYDEKNQKMICCIVIDPFYSTPEVVNDKNTSINNLGFKEGMKIIRSGVYINTEDLNYLDVIYKVTTIYGTSPYFLVKEDKVIGKITNILPNVISPTSVEIDKKSYSISDSRIEKKINNNGIYKVDDFVVGLMGYDGGLIDIDDIAKLNNYDLDIYKEGLILENESTDATLKGMVLTDIGVLKLDDGIGNLELGKKYNFILDEGYIKKAFPTTDSSEMYTINNSIDNFINYTYKDQDLKMELPKYIDYYYKGAKVDYGNVASKLTSMSTIVFVKNEKSELIQAVLYDPVFSKPIVKIDYTLVVSNFEGIDLSGQTVIEKNGQHVVPKEIQFGDVVYEVKNMENTKRYVLVIDKKTYGTITKISPSVTSPKSLEINNKVTYEFSNYMNFSKLSGFGGYIGKYNSDVWIMLDKDGKIIEMFVLN